MGQFIIEILKASAPYAWPIIVFLSILILRKGLLILLEKGGIIIDLKKMKLVIEGIVKDKIKDETTPQLWNDLGTLYLFNKQFSSAELLFLKTLENYANYAPAYWGLGATYRDKSKIKSDPERTELLIKALEYTNEAIKIHKKSNKTGFAAAFLLRATIYQLQGLPYSKVRDDLEKAIACWPKTEQGPNMIDFILEEENLKEVREKEWFQELTKQ